MKLILLAGAAAIGLVAGTTAAQAQVAGLAPNQGWYAAIEGGYNWPNKTSLDTSVIPGGHLTANRQSQKHVLR